MSIEEILTCSLRNPDIDKSIYWMSEPSHVERMSFGAIGAGYLITHETEHIEVCLVTVPAKAFARCRKTGAHVERKVPRRMCDDVQAYYNLKPEGGDPRA